MELLRRNVKRSCLILLIFAIFWTGNLSYVLANHKQDPPISNETTQAQNPDISQTKNLLEIPFVENKGQCDLSVLFYSDSSKGSVGVGINEIIYSFAIPDFVEGKNQSSLNHIDSNIDFSVHNIKRFFWEEAGRSSLTVWMRQTSR